MPALHFTSQHPTLLSAGLGRTLSDGYD